jgi:A/G-specific adenine glycosylase
MLHHNNRVWLEQRPQSGIWGGLFCFPESSDSQIAHQLDSRNVTEATIKRQTQLIAFRHTFSHYHLDITPILVDLSKQPNVVMEGSKGLWYNLSQPEEIGLAAPVKQLLESLPFELQS